MWNCDHRMSRLSHVPNTLEELKQQRGSDSSLDARYALAAGGRAETKASSGWRPCVVTLVWRSSYPEDCAGIEETADSEFVNAASVMQLFGFLHQLLAKAFYAGLALLRSQSKSLRRCRKGKAPDPK